MTFAEYLRRREAKQTSLHCLLKGTRATLLEEAKERCVYRHDVVVTLSECRNFLRLSGTGGGHLDIQIGLISTLGASRDDDAVLVIETVEQEQFLLLLEDAGVCGMWVEGVTLMLGRNHVDPRDELIAKLRDLVTMLSEAPLPTCTPPRPRTSRARSKPNTNVVGTLSEEEHGHWRGMYHDIHGHHRSQERQQHTTTSDDSED